MFIKQAAATRYKFEIACLSGQRKQPRAKKLKVSTPHKHLTTPTYSAQVCSCYDQLVVAQLFD
jgi:hypothetical protein